MIPPVTYLLDTNVVSELMRRNPDPRVAACVDAIGERGIGLASVTVWEVLDGIGRLDPGRRREELLERFQAVLEDLFEGRVLAWTIKDARACADVMERKRRRGEPLDDHLPDAMLAGTAICHGLAIVTRNEAEFRHTGLEIVNPWSVPSA